MNRFDTNEPSQADYTLQQDLGKNEIFKFLQQSAEQKRLAEDRKLLQAKVENSGTKEDPFKWAAEQMPGISTYINGLRAQWAQQPDVGVEQYRAGLTIDPAEILSLVTALQDVRDESDKIYTTDYKTNGQFIEDMNAAYMRNGVENAELRAALVTQDAHETGWGKHTVGNYNYGNIHGTHKGKYRMAADGNPDKRYMAKFRSYDNIDDYIQDKIALLTDRYDINRDDSFESFLDKIGGNNTSKSVYAESPTYKDDLRRSFNSVWKYQPEEPNENRNKAEKRK
jgi:flagellum-specific peptidoglycan hydrolase FlgJ